MRFLQIICRYKISIVDLEFSFPQHASCSSYSYPKKSISHFIVSHASCEKSETTECRCCACISSAPALCIWEIRNAKRAVYGDASAEGEAWCPRSVPSRSTHPRRETPIRAPFLRARALHVFATAEQAAPTVSAPACPVRTTHRQRGRLGVPGRSHRDLPIRAEKHRSTGPCAVPSESRARALRLSLSRRRAV